jgi:hypothetical protein
MESSQMKKRLLSLFLSLVLLNCSQKTKSTLRSTDEFALPKLSDYEQLAEDLRAASEKEWNTTVSIHLTTKQLGWGFRPPRRLYEIYALRDPKGLATTANRWIIGTVLDLEGVDGSADKKALVGLRQETLLTAWKLAVGAENNIYSVEKIDKTKNTSFVRSETQLNTHEIEVIINGRLKSRAGSWPYTTASPPKPQTPVNEGSRLPVSNIDKPSILVPDPFELQLKAVVARCKNFSKEMASPTVMRRVEASNCLGMGQVNFNDQAESLTEAKAKYRLLMDVFHSDKVDAKYKQSSDVEDLNRTINAAYELFKS